MYATPRTQDTSHVLLSQIQGYIERQKASVSHYTDVKSSLPNDTLQVLIFISIRQRLPVNCANFLKKGHTKNTQQRLEGHEPQSTPTQLTTQRESLMTETCLTLRLVL